MPSSQRIIEGARHINKDASTLSFALKQAAPQNSQIQGMKRVGECLIQLFVDVFLEIRDHGHNFLLAQVKTQKKG
jgi:hypothetical protein